MKLCQMEKNMSHYFKENNAVLLKPLPKYIETHLMLNIFTIDFLVIEYNNFIILFFIYSSIRKHKINQLANISDNKYFNIALCQKYFVNDILLRDKYRQNKLTE